MSMYGLVIVGKGQNTSIWGTRVKLCTLIMEKI